MDSKFKHLTLERLSTGYKYAMFSDLNTFNEAIQFLVNLNVTFVASYDCLSYSIICPDEFNFTATKEDGGWTAFKIIGDMPFGTVQGLISNISNSLIKKDIGVCVISTFETDIFLIRTTKFEYAREALAITGWKFSN